MIVPTKENEKMLFSRYFYRYKEFKEMEEQRQALFDSMHSSTDEVTNASSSTNKIDESKQQAAADSDYAYRIPVVKSGEAQVAVSIVPKEGEKKESSESVEAATNSNDSLMLTAPSHDMDTLVDDILLEKGSTPISADKLNKVKSLLSTSFTVHINFATCSWARTGDYLIGNEELHIFNIFIVELCGNVLL